MQLGCLFATETRTFFPFHFNSTACIIVQAVVEASGLYA